MTEPIPELAYIYTELEDAKSAMLDRVAGLRDIKQLKHVIDYQSGGAEFLESQLDELKDQVRNQVLDLYDDNVVDYSTAVGLLLMFGTDDYAPRDTQANLRHRQIRQVAQTRADFMDRYKSVVGISSRSPVFEQFDLRGSKFKDTERSSLDQALDYVIKAGTLIKRVPDEHGKRMTRVSHVPSADLAHSLLLAEASRLLPVIYGQSS